MGVQTCVRFASLLKCQFNVAIIFSGGGEGAGGRGKGEGAGRDGTGRDLLVFKKQILRWNRLTILDIKKMKL